MDSLAIAGMSMQMQAASLQQAVSTRVMKMQMDTAKETARAMLNMLPGNQIMEQSVQPHLGARLDILA